MQKYRTITLSSVLFLWITLASAWASQEEGASIAREFHLVPGTKASIQWKRIFKNRLKRKRYGLDTLSQKQLHELEDYLLEHAADSPKPIVPGL